MIRKIVKPKNGRATRASETEPSEERTAAETGGAGAKGAGEQSADHSAHQSLFLSLRRHPKQQRFTAERPQPH